MEIKIITVPAIGGEELNEEMNRFLRGHKIVCVDKQFYQNSDNAFWTFCIRYLPNAANSNNGVAFSEKKEKVDYKNVLDEKSFAIFSKLRMIRKALAEKDEVPAYAVFTDAELAEISKLENLTENCMLSIPGIGQRKVEKYGKLMLNMLNEETKL